MIYLLYVVTRPWKLRFCHVVLVGYGLACPTLSEITLPITQERLE